MIGTTIVISWSLLKKKVISETEASAIQEIRQFMHVKGASLTPTSPGFESSHEAFTFAIQRVYMYIHPSIFYYCFLGSLGLLESVPAVFGRWPVSLWTSRLFITRPHKKTNNCSHSRFASHAFLFFFFFLFECGTKQEGEESNSTLEGLSPPGGRTHNLSSRHAVLTAVLPQ